MTGYILSRTIGLPATRGTWQLGLSPRHRESDRGGELYRPRSDLPHSNSEGGTARSADRRASIPHEGPDQPVELIRRSTAYVGVFEVPSVEFRQGGGSSPGDASVPPAGGCVAGSGEEIAGPFEIAWSPTS